MASLRQSAAPAGMGAAAAAAAVLLQGRVGVPGEMGSSTEWRNAIAKRTKREGDGFKHQTGLKF